MNKFQEVEILFPKPLTRAFFIQRKKRFIIEAIHKLSGKKLWVHTNNTGSMLGLLKQNREILISKSKNKKRKLPYTLEAINIGGLWVGVNTSYPNKILKLLWEKKCLDEWKDISFQPEVFSGKSRLDACLGSGKDKIWIEAKNVTLVEDEVAYFPDAPTLRGANHLRELISLCQKGFKTYCIFLIQRSDAKCFSPADFIDSEYAKLFWQAVKIGVKVIPLKAKISPRGLTLINVLKIMTS